MTTVAEKNQEAIATSTNILQAGLHHREDCVLTTENGPAIPEVYSVKDQDGSKIEPPLANVKNSHHGVFAKHLHDILCQDKFPSVFHWNEEDNGESFCLEPKQFARTVMGTHFGGKKFGSFARKLNRWGIFRRQSQSEDGENGPGMHVYHHPKLRRDSPGQALLMSPRCRSKERSKAKQQRRFMQEQHKRELSQLRDCLSQEPTPSPPAAATSHMGGIAGVNDQVGRCVNISIQQAYLQQQLLQQQRQRVQQSQRVQQQELQRLQPPFRNTNSTLLSALSLLDKTHFSSASASPSAGFSRLLASTTPTSSFLPSAVASPVLGVGSSLTAPMQMEISLAATLSLVKERQHFLAAKEIGDLIATKEHRLSALSSHMLHKS